MAVVHAKGMVFDFGDEGQYTIEKLVTAGAFAMSSLAEENSGKLVFFKEYTEPTEAQPWFGDYVEHLETLGRTLAAQAGVTVSLPSKLLVSRGQLFQVFELLKGYSLEDYLNSAEKLPLPEGVDENDFYWTISKVFLYSLAQVHSAGIVHCDLKPDNIYLRLNPKARVGLTLQVIDLDWSFFENVAPPWGYYVSTPTWASPEHYRNEPPTTASDVFTAALIVYQCLTGNRPDFDWYTAGFDAELFVDRIRHGRVPLAHELNSDIPHHTSAGLKRALSWDPAQRPSANELLALLGSAAPSGPPGVRLTVAGSTQRYVPVADGAWIGRNELAVLPDTEMVSRVHFRFHHDLPTGKWTVEIHADSRNATKLNGAVLAKSKRYELKPGDRLDVGDFHTIVEF